MLRVSLVALGGAAGSACRYLLGLWMVGRFGGAFPWGTLLINLLGSGLMALIMQLSLSSTRLDPLLVLALTTGFMGGFTTYSTFNFEVLRALQAGAWGVAGTYVALTVTGGLLAGVAGMQLGRLILGAASGG